MRNLSYSLLLIISVACSTEPGAETDITPEMISKKNNITDIAAANSLNPFDGQGQSYLLLLDSFEIANPKPDEINGVISTLEELSDDLGLLTPAYTPESAQEIISIKELSANNLAAALSQLNLSTQGKALLSSTINGLQQAKQLNASFSEVYDVIVASETAVAESSISPADKAVLLSTLSIVRYDIYNESVRKRKDRDWELSVGNIMATANGASQSPPNALINAGASGIIE